MIFYDIETTGLDYNTVNLIQFYGLDSKTGDSLEIKVMREQIKGADQWVKENVFPLMVWEEHVDDLDEGLHSINEFLSRDRNCHYGHYDHAAMSAILNRRGIKPAFDHHSLDLASFIFLTFGFEDVSFKEMCRHFRVYLKTHHNAKDDAIALCNLYNAVMVQSLRL